MNFQELKIHSKKSSSCPLCLGKCRFYRFFFPPLKNWRFRVFFYRSKSAFPKAKRTTFLAPHFHQKQYIKKNVNFKGKAANLKTPQRKSRNSSSSPLYLSNCRFLIRPSSKNSNLEGKAGNLKNSQICYEGSSSLPLYLSN